MRRNSHGPSPGPGLFLLIFQELLPPSMKWIRKRGSMRVNSLSHVPPLLSLSLRGEGKTCVNGKEYLFPFSAYSANYLRGRPSAYQRTHGRMNGRWCCWCRTRSFDLMEHVGDDEALSQVTNGATTTRTGTGRQRQQIAKHNKTQFI